MWEDNDECGDEDDYPEHQQAAEQCIINKYELSDWLDDLQSDNLDFHRNEAPEDASTYWPQAIVYGDWMLSLSAWFCCHA